MHAQGVADASADTAYSFLLKWGGDGLVRLGKPLRDLSRFLDDPNDTPSSLPRFHVHFPPLAVRTVSH